MPVGVLNPVPPINEVEREYLLMMYEEHAEHARHHETLRAAVAAFFIALVAGLLAAPDISTHHPHMVGLAIIVLGLAGLLLNMKHYERFELHREVMKGLRDCFEEAVTVPLRSMNGNRRDVHADKYGTYPWWRWLNNTDLHHFWSGVYGLIIALGFGLLASGRGWGTKLEIWLTTLHYIWLMKLHEMLTTLHDIWQKLQIL